MAHPAADIFRQAARLLQEDPRREGNVVRIEPLCRVVVSGDIHGNGKALARIISFCGRKSSRPTRLVLQEIIHGLPDSQTGTDRSVELLLRAARLKINCPEEVLFVMGNHDLAQVGGVEIAKDGCGACKGFSAGVEAAYGEDAPDVLEAVGDMIRSFPLAAVCPNGAFVTHSVPSPGRMAAAGTEILHRPYVDEDFRRGGPAYEWTWGRGQKAEQLDALAAELAVELFVLGHRHVASGCEVIAPRAVVLASDHQHGRVACFASEVPVTAEAICRASIPVGGIE